MGAFVLEQLVGRGGQADVYRARHVATSQPVAVKVMTGSFDEERLAAFRHELRTVAGLDHPRIVRILGIGRDDDDVPVGLEPGTPWFAMELGTATLRGRVDDWEGLRLVVLDLLDALAHAHARGVLHLDLKARNVLLGCRRGGGLESGLLSGLRLSDFGVARSLLHTGDARVVGTPATMSPEQVRGEGRRFGPWTDLYGLGHLVWELATGQRAYRGSSREILQAHLRGVLPAFEPNFEVPGDLLDWIRWCTAMDPAARPQRALDARLAFSPMDLPRRSTGRGRASIPPPPERDASTLDLDGWTDEVPLPAPQEAPLPPTYERPPLPNDWRRFDTGILAPVLADAGVGLLPFAIPRLVGRELEMDTLWGALLDADLTGRPQVLAVRGPAGIGKTRLVTAFAERVHELAGGLILRVRHHAAPDPSDGLAVAFARSANLTGLTGALLEARIEEALRGMGLVEAWQPRALASWVEGVRTPTVPEIAHGLAALARQRPVLLVVDDARFATETLRVVRALTEVTEAARVCVVLLSRTGDAIETSEEVRSLLDPLGPLAIDLGPLTEEATERLLRGWVGCDAALAGRIAGRARGHPGLALGLVRTLVEDGRLVATPEGLAVSDGPEPDLPADVTESVSRRLAALPSAARAALERVAVAGLSTTRPPEVLLLAELVAPVRGSGWEVPPVVADVVVATMRAEGRLAAEHLRVASQPGLGPERRGYHLVQGGRPDEAVDPLLEGAEAARVRGDIRSSARMVDLAAQALEALQEDDPRWAAWWEQRIGVLRSSGAVRELEQEVDRVVPIATERGWEAVLAGASESRALIARQKMERQVAKDWAMDAVRRWTALGRTRDRLRAMTNAAGFHVDDRDEVTATRLVAEVLADPDTAVRERMAVRANLALLHTSMGRHEEAIRELSRSAEEPDAEQDDALFGTVHRELAYHLIVLGKLDEARLHLEIAEASARRSGTALMLARVLQVRSWWHYLTGDPGEAMRHTVLAADLYERVGGYPEVARLTAAIYHALAEEWTQAGEGARRYLLRGARAGNNALTARLVQFAAEPVADPAAAWAELEPQIGHLTPADFLTVPLLETVEQRRPEVADRVRAAIRRLVTRPGWPG
ncbi:MAG: protein kinase [Alphaproteobacteria bacterium]|nr:protein kinase [Alphaproteobacteria bacterium]MCB9696705.1 protein kinase [Alphaproteobacteria bacterium]